MVDTVIYGPSLSSLLYECASSPHDMEGLLIGSTTSHPTKEREDFGDISSSDMVTKIGVEGFVPTGRLHSFYGSGDFVDLEKLHTFLSQCPSDKRVIGWFRYRRGVSARVSLQERAIHRRVREELDTFYQSRNPSTASALGLPPPCIFFVLSREIDFNACTHSFDYSAHYLDGTQQFVPVNIRVSNLTQSSVAEYEQFEALSATFEESTIGSEIFGGSTSTVSSVMEGIVQPLVTHLDDHIEGILGELEQLAGELSATCDATKEAEARVGALRAKLAAAKS